MSETEKSIIIEDVLTRGVGKFIDPENKFRNKLQQAIIGNNTRPVVVKYGVDPTRPDIHLGHALCFRKLRQLQQLGCKIIFLVGDFTASIGDPTGKSKIRPEIDQIEVNKNVTTFLDQIKAIFPDVERNESGNIVENTKFSWIRNSDWYVSPADVDTEANQDLKVELNGKEVDKNSLLAKSAILESNLIQKRFLKPRLEYHFATLVNLLFNLRNITLQQLKDRDMFDARLKNNDPLFMHEMLYPVLQGIDSIILARIYESCDLELGGTDQEFNMLMGRDLMSADQQLKEKNVDPQSVITLKLLEGIDGKQKMSKSLDNYIAITDTPNKMFTSVMSIPDTSIVNYFELTTDVPMSEIHELDEKMKSGEIHPQDLKARLAREIVTLYHGAVAAENAEEARPSQAPPETTIIEFMVTEKLASSKSDARRKIEQGGVELDGEKVTDWQMELNESHNGKILKVGKKDFVKIVF